MECFNLLERSHQSALALHEEGRQEAAKMWDLWSRAQTKLAQPLGHFRGEMEALPTYRSDFLAKALQPKYFWDTSEARFAVPQDPFEFEDCTGYKSRDDMRKLVTLAEHGQNAIYRFSWDDAPLIALFLKFTYEKIDKSGYTSEAFVQLMAGSRTRIANCMSDGANREVEHIYLWRHHDFKRDFFYEDLNVIARGDAGDVFLLTVSL